MGKRGPPPKPTAQKVLEGTYRPDRAVRNEWVPPVGAPPTPPGLDPVALARWEELAPELVSAGVLARVDGSVLEGHCRAFALFRRYTREAEKRPMINTPWGRKPNPAAAEAKLWLGEMNRCGDRLGIGASARSRISTPEKPKEDAAEKFLFGAGKLQVVEGGKNG
jgi:P27 family predicted phage terminase small subunit